MSIEQFVAILGGLTALLVVVVQLLVAVRSLHSAVNGRLTLLLDQAVAAARKDGELAGRDFMMRLARGVPEPVDGASDLQPPAESPIGIPSAPVAQP